MPSEICISPRNALFWERNQLVSHVCERKNYGFFCTGKEKIEKETNLGKNIMYEKLDKTWQMVNLLIHSIRIAHIKLYNVKPSKAIQEIFPDG